jgi:hypothetical protein
MRIRPTDERVKMPLVTEFAPEQVGWIYHGPTKTWEITLGWVVLELTEAECEAFVSTWVTQWEHAQWEAGAIPDTRKLTVAVEEQP